MAKLPIKQQENQELVIQTIRHTCDRKHIFLKHIMPKKREKRDYHRRHLWGR